MITRKVKILIEVDESQIIKDDKLLPELEDEVRLFVQEMRDHSLKCSYEVSEEKTIILSEEAT